jgi:dTDP-4-amino-4,6-dideoxygalactose transaminase
MYSHKAQITDDDIQAVVDCMSDRELFGTGKITAKLEQVMVELTGYEHCVVVNCGSAALNLAVKAIKIQCMHDAFLEDCVVGFVPKNTYIASARCFTRANIKVVTYDSPEEIAGLMEANDWGIGMAVHYAGTRVDMNLFGKCSYIIEDATHALSTDMLKYKNAATDAVVYSFNATKNATGGQGGCLLTDDEQLATIVRNLRHYSMNHCIIPEYVIKYGGNYKLADINSALILSQLKSLSRREVDTRELVSRYDVCLDFLNGDLNIPKGFWAIGECTWRANYPHLIILKFGNPININPISIVDRLRNVDIYTNVYYPDITKLISGNGECSNVKTEYITLPLDHQLSMKDCRTILEKIYNIAVKYQ